MNKSAERFIGLIRKYGGMILFAGIVGGFAFVASRQIEAVPVPDTDEAMTLQVPYEMIYRGKLAFPMYRFLGGNIENVWHSYTPVFFLATGGFMKLFGWGLMQGRVFNLITAVALLLMVFLIGQRLKNWQSGLIAVALMISDPVFFARSRLARNDMLAAGLGLLAFYLYERAQEQERKSLYVASGIAAGAGVMCHTKLIYILAVIAGLLLLKWGWRVVKSSRLYLFIAGAFAVMAYEVVYDIIDYRNFVLQNRKDTIHFRILEPLGWLRNIIDEPARYVDWFKARGVKFAPDATLLHIFLILAAVAIPYLAIRSVIRLKRNGSANDSRARIIRRAIALEPDDGTDGQVRNRHRGENQKNVEQRCVGRKLYAPGLKPIDISRRLINDVSQPSERFEDAKMNSVLAVLQYEVSVINNVVNDLVCHDRERARNKQVQTA